VLVFFEKRDCECKLGFEKRNETKKSRAIKKESVTRYIIITAGRTDCMIELTTNSQRMLANDDKSDRKLDLNMYISLITVESSGNCRKFKTFLEKIVSEDTINF
jgi:hypothetical protein